MNERVVSQENIQQQLEFITFVSHINRDKKLKAYTVTFGCQQNEADTQRVAGMLHDMGYEKTTEIETADIIIVNTCAIRETAEHRVLGNIGEMKHLKQKNPNLIIAMCGCMVQQEHITEKIKKSYPHVDLIFGTHALWKFPQLLYTTITGDKRVIDITNEEKGTIAEGLPVLRDGNVHAWLSIMYGCNNFCTYCIVPYVRGRERSRSADVIESEFRELVASGYKDITLLGQNVNSYGKDLDESIDFADLLARINAIEGDFTIRFMTSHPKDATEKLFDTMANCQKVARQLHLPFQSGSDDVLKRMNRGYTSDKYRNLIKYAREKMPELTISSDIIVGFPNETDEDFEGTLSLVDEIKFDALFTFQYSKRSGTPAATFEDLTPHTVKQARFEKLLRLQDSCVEPKMQAYKGRTMRVLVDGKSRQKDYTFTARTSGSILVYVTGEDVKIGEFIDVIIEKTTLRSIYGRKL